MNKEIAKILLEIKAVHLEPDNFFTWTSGIKSPIYCDNRQVISYPEHRSFIVNRFIDLIKLEYPQTEIIAGTATAGIPWAAWIADKMNLPMLYIRSTSKGHGLQNALEGKVEIGKKVLVIEDLISTGKSSIAAAKEVRQAKLDLLGVVSIFSYAFKKADQAFKADNIAYSPLCDLDTMLDFSAEEQLLTSEQIDIIKQWKTSIENN
jgi:orotate phosphoribosyltransferase